MCLAQLLAQAARALSLAPAALALVVQLSARVLAVLALAASARAAQALVAQALIELAQAALVALVAMAQVGLAALGFVAVVPKLLRGVRATDLKPLLLRLCWSWPACRLDRPEALSPQVSHHTQLASVRSPGGAVVVCWSVCPDQPWFDQSRLDQSRSDQ